MQKTLPVFLSHILCPCVCLSLSVCVYVCLFVCDSASEQITLGAQSVQHWSSAGGLIVGTAEAKSLEYA